MNKLLPLFVLFAIVTSGCSSIVSKSDYPVSLNSTPDGAHFTVTNRAGELVHSGTTPGSVVLHASSGFFKSEKYTITIEKEGYAPKTTEISSSVDGWYLGNILFGGLIGMLIVDPATGAMFTLPDRANVELDQVAPEAVTQSDMSNLHIATLDSLTPEQRKRLQRIN